MITTKLIPLRDIESGARLSSAEIDRMANDLRNVKQTKTYKPMFSSVSAYAKAVYGISRSYTSRLVSGRRSTRKNISEATRWRIWERDDFRCHYCGARKYLSVDHKVSLELGGSDCDSNLVTACKTCNSKKNAKSYDAFFPPFMQAFRMFQNVTGVR